MKMKKVGIVGCGSIAATHIWALNKMKNVKIVAAADIIPERAKKLMEEYVDYDVPVFDSLEEMIAQADLDVLHICTPHYLHAPMALTALRKGISVFSEKPPAISRDQFLSLKEEAHRGRARLGFCFQNRYNRTMIETDKLIDSGELGKVIGARAFVTWCRDEAYYASPWKGKLETEGGGALINQAIHTLDLLLKYFDMPKKVKAGIAKHHLSEQIEVEDTVEAYLEFEQGERACFYATTAYTVDAPIILEYQCERGSIMIYDKLITVKENGGNERRIVCEEENGIGKTYWGNGHLNCIKDYYEKLETKERFPCDIDGVSKTFETMMQIYDYR